jgi:hypothetical protein
LCAPQGRLPRQLAVEMVARLFYLPGRWHRSEIGLNWFVKLIGGARGGQRQPEPPPPTDAKYTLEKSIRSHLAPVLRAEGFVGSGRTFRRIGEHLIQVVQVQGSQWGGQFAVNLGIQPTCIQSDLSTPADFRKIAPEACEFRRRLSTDGADQWWSYVGTPESMDAAVAEATEVYLAVGPPAFAAMSDANSPIWTLTPKEFAGRAPKLLGFESLGFMSTEVRMARALALMRQAAGNRQDAVGFARHALDQIGDGPGGDGLRQELRAIVQGG